MLNLEEIERLASEEWQSTQPPSLCRLLVRNEIPALIRELRILREQLLRHGGHYGVVGDDPLGTGACEIFTKADGHCTCGWDAIKQELEQEAIRE